MPTSQLRGSMVRILYGAATARATNPSAGIDILSQVPLCAGLDIISNRQSDQLVRDESFILPIASQPRWQTRIASSHTWTNMALSHTSVPESAPKHWEGFLPLPDAMQPGPRPPQFQDCQGQ